MDKQASSLSECIESYSRAVAGGEMPRAYRGILTALSQFQSAWEQAHPEDSTGSLYQGYLDMSFLAVTPRDLAAKRLKISLVYLHAEGVFTLWLTAGNRAIQKRVSQALRAVPLKGYALTVLEPGVDAVIAKEIQKPYPFDEPARLTQYLLAQAEAFAADMILLSEQIPL